MSDEGGGIVAWKGVLACISGLVFHWLSTRSGRDVTSLKSVKRVPKINQLVKVLGGARGVGPQVVAVAGRVGSDNPITTQHTNLRAVIAEEIAEQFFLKHNDAGAWVQDSAFLLHNTRTVPWYLEDETGRAYVVGARQATGLELSVASEVFEDTGRSLMRGTLDYLQGIKVLGVKRVEKVLPVGAALTVVAEAVPNDMGTVTLQRPQRGGPFYVSHRTVDQLISSLGFLSRCFHYLSLGWTALGLSLLAARLINRALNARRRATIRARVLEHEASLRESQSALTTETEGEEVASGAAVSSSSGSKGVGARVQGGSVPEVCVICLEHNYNSVFVPCGHMCCCLHCASQLSHCPLCRRRIDQLVRTYRH